MRVEYRFCLRDHDFVIAFRHKLIPSAYVAVEIKPNGLGKLRYVVGWSFATPYCQPPPPVARLATRIYFVCSIPPPHPGPFGEERRRGEGRDSGQLVLASRVPLDFCPNLGFFVCFFKSRVGLGIFLDDRVFAEVGPSSPGLFFPCYGETRWWQWTPPPSHFP